MTTEIKKNEVRSLRGFLRSRRAIEKFLEGCSGSEFEVRVMGTQQDALDTNYSEKLRPFETSGRDWYTPYLGWISGGSFTLDQIDSVRKQQGGTLEVESIEC